MIVSVTYKSIDWSPKKHFFSNLSLLFNFFSPSRCMTISNTCICSRNLRGFTKNNTCIQILYVSLLASPYQFNPSPPDSDHLNIPTNPLHQGSRSLSFSRSSCTLAATLYRVTTVLRNPRPNWIAARFDADKFRNRREPMPSLITSCRGRHASGWWVH